MSSGFFVPNSVSSNYVANKKTDKGSYAWDDAVDETNLSKQVALQSVNKQYASTIDNAYSNYLAANRGVIGSNMGQGYKEAYVKTVKDQLAAQVQETNYTAANVRNEIGTNTNEAQQAIQDAYNTEVANMDRTYRYANDYLGYLKTLSGATDGTSKYLTPDQESLSIDDMYEHVFQAQPKDYLDENGNIGLSYSEWVNSQLKGTETDNQWAQWLFSQGGLQQSVKAAGKAPKPYTKTPAPTSTDLPVKSTGVDKPNNWLERLLHDIATMSTIN